MSENIINAVSKFRQDEKTLELMAERAFGKKLNSFKYRELAGGLSNAAYLIDADGEKAVLKIAPEKSVTVMAHEENILSTEAEMLRVFSQKINIPAPRLIYYDNSAEVCKSDYFFMTFMEGRPLGTLEEKPSESVIGQCKYEVGVITRKICSIKAPCFGIPAMKNVQFNNNYEFVSKLFSMLYEDIEAKGGNATGIGHKDILGILSRCKDILNEETNPVYIHTDTWDGNIMVKDNKFVGLIDYAAILFGDPLMSHDFHDFSPVPRKEFLEGYGKTVFTHNEIIRITIYKIWQRLGMIAERYYRGYEDKNQFVWVLDEYVKAVDELKLLLK